MMQNRGEFNIQIVSELRSDNRKRDKDFPTWLNKLYPIKENSLKKIFIKKIDSRKEEDFSIFEGHDPWKLLNDGLKYYQIKHDNQVKAIASKGLLEIIRIVQGRLRQTGFFQSHISDT